MLVPFRLVEPPNSLRPIAFHQRTARLSLVCSTTRAWLLPILYNTVHLESRRDAASFLLGLGIRVEVVLDDKTSTDLAAGFGGIGLGPEGYGYVTRDQDLGVLTFAASERSSANDKQLTQTQDDSYTSALPRAHCPSRTSVSCLFLIPPKSLTLCL